MCKLCSQRRCKVTGHSYSGERRKIDITDAVCGQSLGIKSINKESCCTGKGDWEADGSRCADGGPRLEIAPDQERDGHASAADSGQA